jgi:hypothetical protein
MMTAIGPPPQVIDIDILPVLSFVPDNFVIFQVPSLPSSQQNYRQKWPLP